MALQIPAHTAHWLLGSAREIFPQIHRFIAGTATRYGGIVRFRILNRILHATVRPEDARHILVDNVDGYIKSYHYKTGAAINGNGIISSNGEVWRHHRRKVQKAFKRSALQPVAEIAAEECESALENWDASQTTGRVIDIIPEMRGIALRAMTRALLGYSLETDDAHRFERDLIEGMYAAGRRNNGAALPLWLPTPNNRKLKRAAGTLRDILHTEVMRRRVAIQTGSETPGGMIDKYVGDEDMSESEVYDETTTLFTAGFETSATALSWALAMLAMHPEITHACCEEVDRVLGGRQVTSDDLPSLQMITAAYEETLRLYPPIVQVGRENLDVDELSGYRLPKGSTIIVSMFGIHRSPALWSNPDTFDPSRFLPERRHEIPANAYLPFGLGRRTCVGNYFAHQEQIAVIATILQRYRLEMPKSTKVDEVLRVTLQPGTQLPLHAIPRCRS